MRSLIVMISLAAVLLFRAWWLAGAKGGGVLCARSGPVPMPGYTLRPGLRDR